MYNKFITKEDKMNYNNTNKIRRKKVSSNEIEKRIEINNKREYSSNIKNKTIQSKNFCFGKLCNKSCASFF